MDSYVEIIGKFPRVKVLVIGDAMIDQYHYGRVDRISPEAPVPIFVEDYSKAESRRGGADNVAHQLEVWGCHVETVFPKRRSVKHRYLVGTHQVFRRDSDSAEEITFSGYPLMSGPDVIVLSDYGKGFLTSKFCQEIIPAAKDLKIPVIVDPKGRDWSKYQGATVICPNEKELVDESFPRIILKMGAEGIHVIENGTRFRVPARSVPVFDVCGAGDTVVAAIAACLGGGTGSLEIAARMACAAASVVIQKVGTSICTTEELLCALGSPTAASIVSMKDISNSSGNAGATATTLLSRSIPTEVLRFLRDLGGPDEN